MSLAFCGFREFHFVFEVSDGRVRAVLLFISAALVLGLIIGNR